MLNAERFKKEILDVMDKKDTGLFGVYNRNSNIFFDCKSEKCQNCIFDNAVRGDFKKSCGRAKIEWLLSEYKEPPVKVSKLEYDILKYLSDNTAYLYIVRESTSNLFVYRLEPTKGAHGWNGRGYTPLTVFNKLFLFIKWEDEESTPIKDVLKKCEVVENETK